MNVEELIEAVRAGDIKKAQSLLPVDSITKRAREIAARHFGNGNASGYLDGDFDKGPVIGAIEDALTIPDDRINLAARGACYAFASDPQVSESFLSGEYDGTSDMARVRQAIKDALQ